MALQCFQQFDLSMGEGFGLDNEGGEIAMAGEGKAGGGFMKGNLATG